MWGAIKNRPVTSFQWKQAVKEPLVGWYFVFNASVVLLVFHKYNVGEISTT